MLGGILLGCAADLSNGFLDRGAYSFFYSFYKALSSVCYVVASLLVF